MEKEIKTNLDKNEVKKDLFKSKAMAKFSHYVSGNLYYTVELNDGTYQFPISMIDTGTLSEIEERDLFVNDYDQGVVEFDKKIFITDKVDENGKLEELILTKLSSDLGTTSFYAEVRGSELSRWISKAIDKNEFVKII